MYLQKIKPFLSLGILYLIVSFLLRLVFVLHPITADHFSIGDILKVAFIGLVNDIFVFIIASSFLALYFLFLSNGKYQNPYGKIILGIFVAAFLYVLLTASAPPCKYNSTVVTILSTSLLSIP